MTTDDDEENDSEEEKSSKEKSKQVKKTKKKKPKTRAGRKKARLAKEKAAREALEASKKRKQAKTALAFASLATDAAEDVGHVKRPMTTITPHKIMTTPTTIGKPVTTFGKPAIGPSRTRAGPSAMPTTIGKPKLAPKRPLATAPTTFGAVKKPATAVGTTIGSKVPPQTRIEAPTGAKKLVSFMQKVDSEVEEDASQLGDSTRGQSALPTVSQLGVKTAGATKIGGRTEAAAATASSEVLPTVSQLATKMGGATTAAGTDSTTEAPLPTASQLATKMGGQTTASDEPLPTVSQLGAKTGAISNIPLESKSAPPSVSPSGVKSPTQEEVGDEEIAGGSTLTVSQLAAKTEIEPSKLSKDLLKKVAPKKDVEATGGQNLDEEQTISGKIMLCSCCCICFVIFLSLSTLIGYLTHPYFIPLFKKRFRNDSVLGRIVARSRYDRLILNLHESCAEKYGPCAVFREKYVDDCREAICDTVTLIMDLKQIPMIQTPVDVRQTVRASFRPADFDESRKVPVSEDTPCTYRVNNESSTSRLIGSCRRGVCQPSKDRMFLRYYARPPVHGHWSNYEKFSEKESCLKVPKDIDISSVGNLCSSNTSCSPYRYVFRSCTNPPPIFGGRYCWSIDGAGASPSTLAMCHQCPEHIKSVADWPIDCGRAQSLYKDRCAMTHHGALRKSKGRIFHTDFKTCCPEGAARGEHRGRCLFGNCWIADKIA